MTIQFVQHIDKHIEVGNLIGNRFTIRLHGLKNKALFRTHLLNLQKNGYKNFYGPQRFGLQLRNHIRGRELLSGHPWNGSKDRAKFLIHAYQSWLFNLALESYAGPRNFSPIRLPGFRSPTPKHPLEKHMHALLKEDDLTLKDFQRSDLHLTSTGTTRAPYTRLTDLNYSLKEPVTLRFMLGKGSYATTLLQELISL